MAMKKEALTNLIADDLASRNDNWTEIDNTFALNTAQLAEIETDVMSLKEEYANYVNKIKLPNYGVDYMTYKQRLNRMPITATNHKYIDLDLYTSDIDGEQAYQLGTSLGGSTSVIKNFAIPETLYPYIAFDYYAEDINLSSLRVDVITTSGTNFMRFTIDITKIKVGINHIIINKAIPSSTTGVSDWNSITSITIRASASVGLSHVSRVSKLNSFAMQAKVSVWFDDGHSSVFYNAKPTMDLYDFKGIQAIIGNKIGVDTSTLTTSQMYQMQAEGWEHCNHTNSHIKFGETTPQIAEISLQRGLDYCLAHNFGKSSYYLVNPGGQSTPETDLFEKKYCTVRRKALGYNYFPIVDMHNLAVKEPIWETTPAEVQSWIDTAIQGGLWLILLFHQIRPAELPGAMRYPQASFNSVMAYLNTKKLANELQVVTCSEALSSI